jgi:hypothetical protein
MLSHVRVYTHVGLAAAATRPIRAQKPSASAKTGSSQPVHSQSQHQVELPCREVKVHRVATGHIMCKTEPHAPVNLQETVSGSRPMYVWVSTAQGHTDS